MRLIDADALIEFIENRYDITWKDDYEGGIKDACTDILEKISKMPAIEPERKTGWWVLNKKESEKHIEGIYECSACHNNDAWGTTECTRYCSWCGAKMLGARNDEEADLS